MKNIKLALVCLALSNIYLIKSMEEEEEEYPYYYDQESSTQHGEIEKQKEEYEDAFGTPFTDFIKPDSFMSFDSNAVNSESSETCSSPQFFKLIDFKNRLDSSNVFEDIQPSSIQIIEGFFNTMDTYNALVKSFDYVRSLDPNWHRFANKDVDITTKELLCYIVRKLSHISDIKPLFNRALEENNDTIKAATICSKGKINNFSIDKFYEIFKKMDFFAFRTIDNTNQVMMPFLSNIHSSLMPSILHLQIATGYPLLNLFDTVMTAFLSGKKELLDILIGNNLVPIDPLFKAAFEGNIEYLQRTSFDINIQDPLTNLTILGFAIIGGHKELAEMLITHGANVELGNTLHMAVLFGYLDLVKLLIAHGANINTRCTLRVYQNDRPIDIALSRNYSLLIWLLFELEQNLPSEVKEEDQRYTFSLALDYENEAASMHILTTYPQCFSIPYLSVIDGRDFTPIHTAARYNFVRIAEFLINAKATLSLNKQTSKYGNTPLHIAAEGGHYQIVELLLDAGAKQKRNHYGSTPIDYAKSAFIIAETRKERNDALKTFKLLYDADKIASNPHPNPRLGDSSQHADKYEAEHIDMIKRSLENSTIAAPMAIIIMRLLSQDTVIAQKVINNLPKILPQDAKELFSHMEDDSANILKLYSTNPDIAAQLILFLLQDPVISKEISSFLYQTKPNKKQKTKLTKKINTLPNFFNS